MMQIKVFECPFQCPSPNSDWLQNLANYFAEGKITSNYNKKYVIN